VPAPGCPPRRAAPYGGCRRSRGSRSV
jgi:hypothetical protein